MPYHITISLIANFKQLIVNHNATLSPINKAHYAAFHEVASWKVMGSNPGANKRNFSNEIFASVKLFHHLDVELVHYDKCTPNAILN